MKYLVQSRFFNQIYIFDKKIYFCQKKSIFDAEYIAVFNLNFVFRKMDQSICPTVSYLKLSL